MSTVRLEFRADELVFDPADPVFGGALCRVPSCPRTGRGGRGLCAAHHDRWITAGRPDPDAFAASTDPRWHKQAPLACCRAPGCGRGVARQGLCVRHAQSRERAGRPALPQWLAAVPVTCTPAGQALCQIAACGLWAEKDIPFCNGHGKTWKANGCPGAGEFIRGYAEIDVVPRNERIFLGGLPAQLKLEIQYALQRRRDERTVKVQPFVVTQVVRFLATCPVTSLLDWPEETWRQRIGRPAPKDSNPRALLIFARRQAEDLADAGGGWDVEYGRDVWRLHNLGFEGRQTLRFDRIPQPWLKELAKRWARWRISTGLCLEASRRAVRAVERFAQFLSAPAVNIARLGDVDRPLLERYLADLHAEMAGSQRQGAHVGLLNSFFTAIRQHHWDDTLPATAMFFPQDLPKRSERPPRALAEHVMAQVEHPGNLDRWGNAAYRLVTLILIHCGLRVSDALRLERDCIACDADGAPYLRYFNHKMKREALVPIDEELRHLIDEQQHRVLERWPRIPPGLFPRPTKNLDGTAPVSSSTYRLALYRWLERCDVQDEHGLPVHFTPHQWRHTLGTRMINRDVPQEVVRRILDHDSSADDRPLRPAARHHGPPALGSRPQSKHHRAAGHPRSGRAAGRSRVGQTAPGQGHPGPAQRILRPASAENLPARQRVPDLPDVHHDPGVPAPAPRSPAADHPDHLRGRSPRPDPPGRDEPADPGEPRQHHHRAPGRHRIRGGHRRCRLTTPPS